jgi:hypothetical protein
MRHVFQKFGVHWPKLKVLKGDGMSPIRNIGKVDRDASTIVTVYSVSNEETLIGFNQNNLISLIIYKD